MSGDIQERNVLNAVIATTHSVNRINWRRTNGFIAARNRIIAINVTDSSGMLILTMSTSKRIQARNILVMGVMRSTSWSRRWSGILRSVANRISWNQLIDFRTGLKPIFKNCIRERRVALKFFLGCKTRILMTKKVHWSLVNNPSKQSTSNLI